MNVQDLGNAAVTEKGWWKAHQWLILRRLSQGSILALFLLGPLAGIWIVKGNLTSNLVLDTVPLMDPFVLSQSLAAGHWPANTALIGAAIVLGFYSLVGGRAYCAWVCPVNIVTDAAFWLRRRLGIRGGGRVDRTTRYWVLAMVLAIAAITETMVWELVNPVSMTHRAIIFGMGFGWAVIVAVFLFDLLLVERGWCSHLCPMGAFYALVGSFSPLRIKAARRSACNDCAECYLVCPEAQIIKPVLKGEAHGVGPMILSSVCNNCGRCIDICSKRVFEFSTRYSSSLPKLPKATSMEPGS